MIVFCSIVFWGFVGLFVPRNHMRGYLIIGSLCLPFLYFFFRPPMEYDLFRHYELLQLFRNNKLSTIVSDSVSEYNKLLDQYSEGSFIYLVYAYVISLLKIDQLLPVITGMIIYAAISKIILMSVEDLGVEVQEWKIVLCFFFLLAVSDFRSISGIRNMLSYALFALAAYYDLVRNANKPLCFLCYLLLAGLHSSIFILIIIRLLIMLDKGMLKWIIALIMLLSYSMLDLALTFMSRFSHIPMINYLVEKINFYGIEGGSGYNIRRALIFFFMILVQFFIYLYAARFSGHEWKFKRYGHFFFYYSLFAFGAVRQYDIFVRSNLLICFMVFPFLLTFLNTAVGETPAELFAPEKTVMGFRETILYLLIYGAILMALYMYVKWHYIPMDSSFSFQFGLSSLLRI